MRSTEQQCNTELRVGEKGHYGHDWRLIFPRKAGHHALKIFLMSLSGSVLGESFGLVLVLVLVFGARISKAL